MRIAAIVPTRGRPETARRAIASFLVALDGCGVATSATVIAVDDSDDETAGPRLHAMLQEVLAYHPAATLEILRRAPDLLPRRSVAAPGGGPGATRNRGLARLRQFNADPDVIVMFDDDVCFADVDYRGDRLECDGVALLGEAVSASAKQRSVVGCTYVGRQDLSILEHARLDIHGPDGRAIAPATERSAVECVAPGGISTAFLVTRAPARLIPDFPEHYNEDYIWLHALRRSGWPLIRLGRNLAHAPPGDVLVTAPALSFQIFGEIVWLAVLEEERFPITSPSHLAAAVREITGDLRNALASDPIQSRPEAVKVIAEVLDHYERLEQGAAFSTHEPLADELRHAIARGIALRPGGFC